MLRCLRIQNFAIIDQVEIEFGDNLNIISGETGAGKSIIMDALSIVLGNRASSEIIRAGAAFTSVEALFEVKSNAVVRLLNELGIEVENNEIIVRRIIQKNGKNRAFVNDYLVNLSSLQKIVSAMVDLCSQHDQKLLSSKDEQVLWLDRFSDLLELRGSVREKHSAWKDAEEKLNALQASQNERAQRIDFLQFQINEIEEAKITDISEDEEIERELGILNNAEALLSFSNRAEAAILGADEEGNATADEIGALVAKADDMISKDEKLKPAKEFLSDLKILLDEAGYFFRDYSKTLTLDESRLDDLNARAKQLNDLKRKYGSSLQEVLRSLDKFRTELSELKNHDESLNMAKETLHQMYSALESECGVLTSAREKAAAMLSTAIETELRQLNLERARFKIDMKPLLRPTKNGMDEVTLLFSANPGEPLQDLAKIASGGELSRVMLALHNVLSNRTGVSVYLFDEVDTGIGGKTAMVVGRKLQNVSRNSQVICITHLPQVACFADSHYRVEKSVQKSHGTEKTICSVIRLDEKLRTFEVARMLGGIDASPQAIANAKDLIEKASANAT